MGYVHEQWKVITNYEDYFISNYGRVKSTKWDKEKILKQRNDGRDYLTVYIVNKSGVYKNLYVHRLVAEAFLGSCPKNKEVNHKDRNKKNNCVGNLEYMTHLKNINHGLGRKNILTDKKVRKIIKLYKSGKYKKREISDLYNISPSYVYMLASKRRRKNA